MDDKPAKDRPTTYGSAGEEDVAKDLIRETDAVKDVRDVFTIDEAMEKLGFGFFQILITIFCGLVWLADAMELMILSVLAPLVKCDWNLSASDEANITTVVFLGFLVGALFWGSISDIFGRRTSLGLCAVLILIFGLLSAAPVPNTKQFGYPWLLVCRFGVGIAAGGSSQSVTYYSEFLPKKARGVCIVLLDLYWGLGSVFGSLLAFAVVERLGWRWYLAMAATPLALVLFFLPFIPESARFYMIQGKGAQAKKVMDKVAWFNRKKPLMGKLVSQEEKEQLIKNAATSAGSTATSLEDSPMLLSRNGVHLNGSQDTEEDLKDKEPLIGGGGDQSPRVQRRTLSAKIHHQMKVFNTLFTKGMWKTTVLLLLIWFGCALLYYGVVLLTTSILVENTHCGVVNTTVCNATYENCTCKAFGQNDYLYMTWTSAAEFPGIFLTLLIIELIGRKITMAVEFFGCVAGFLLLLWCVPKAVTTMFLFLIRGLATGAFQAAYAYTPEVYPTNVRAIGMGVNVAAARLGAIVTPYVAQVSYDVNFAIPIGLYAGISLLVGFASLALPFETKGKSLKDGVANH
ncbi:hypothetical protein EMCRGX_G024256 [Ephydatia muelleri]